MEVAGTAPPILYLPPVLVPPPVHGSGQVQGQMNPPDEGPEELPRHPPLMVKARRAQTLT